MIRHGPGMALCLKYATNKVPSVAPLVAKLSHAAVCSRQISKQSIKSPFLHEGLINGDISSLVCPSHTQTFVDPAINDEQCREKKYEGSRCVSSWVIDDEDIRTIVQLRQSSFSCHCNTNLLSVPRHHADSLSHSKICNIYHLQEMRRPMNCNLSHFDVEIQKSSPVKEGENLNPNSTQNDQRLDSLKPPTPEQLQKVLDTLAYDLPRFFIKPLKSKNYANIYHRNIIFEDNIRGRRFSGFDQYILQANFVYLFSHLRFMYVNLDVLKITLHPEDGTVKVRWRITVLRVRRLWKLFQIGADFQQCKDTWIDGFSTYYVMGDGLVHKHVADKMMPDQEQMKKKETPTKSVPVPHPLAYSDRNKI